jgi:hypothetical protein
MFVTREQVLQVHANDTVLAQPGEPIVNISAHDACRKVNGYLGEEISLMMHGTDPALIYSEGRVVWRVPIELASPMRGHIGFIGSLDVDTRSSELIIPPTFVADIQANARALLKGSPYSPEN